MGLLNWFKKKPPKRKEEPDHKRIAKTDFVIEWASEIGDRISSVEVSRGFGLEIYVEKGALAQVRVYNCNGATHVLKYRIKTGLRYILNSTYSM